MCAVRFKLHLVDLLMTFIGAYEQVCYKYTRNRTDEA